MERTLTVLTDVKDLGELLGGANIDLARLVPSGRRLRLELELTRACPELQTVVRRAFVTRTKTPWVKSRLTFDHVQDAAVQRLAEAPAGQAPVLSCEAIPGGYTLTVTSPDGLRLVLTLAQLSGQFADVSQPLAVI